MLTYGIPPEFRGGVHMKPPYAIGSVPSLSGHAVAYRWRSLPRVRRHRASKPQGSSERVLPWQITMDQLIFASLTYMRIQQWTVHEECICTQIKIYVNKSANSSTYYVLPTDASTRTFHFPVQLTTSKFGNLTRLIHTLL